MKTRTKVILTILALLAIAIGAVVVWQWNNLMALHDGLTMDPIAIQEELEEQQEQFDAVMDEYQVPHKEFTQEEIDQLVSGALSASEMADSMLQGTKPSNDGGQQQEESTDPTTDVEGAIQKEIATMYVLRATYEGKLEAIVQSALDEYAANDGSRSREDIVYSKMNELTALEKECDQQVEEVTFRLRDLLTQAGKDTALADQAEETYQAEKSMKKAYYIQKFREG